ncbi:MAG: SPOR domain-containing protein, partial [Burkholderiales bacterium]|nr:SPOR domain-containing protein [Burkholderiales bacterium]
VPAPPPAADKAAPAQPAPAKPAQVKPAQAKPESAEPAASAAEGSRTYVLQLGVFKERANAESVAAKASALGLKPAIAQTESGSWRVGLGPYADRSKALAIRDKVREAGLAVVVKTP